MAVPLSDIHMQSTRLSLKPFSADDADAAFFCITPSLARFMSWEVPASRAAFDRTWQAWLPAMAAGEEFVFAVRQRTDGGFLGLTGLHRVTSDDPELGIWIREDRHRQGFGPEAVGMVAQWATQALGIASFLYPVAEANRPSRRLAESLGGIMVGRRTMPKFDAVIYRIPGR